MKRHDPLKIEIFVIDDDESIIEVIDIIFKMNGIQNYRLFTDPYELLKNLNDNVHICIVDYKLNGMNGLELIKEVVKRNRHCLFIMLSGQTDNKVIIEYMNSVFGSRYVEKSGSVPFSEGLMFHLGEIIKHIYFVDNFYLNATRIKEGFNDLKKDLKKLFE